MTALRFADRRLLAGCLIAVCLWSAARRVPTGAATGMGLRGDQPLVWQQLETLRVATWNIHSGRGRDGQTDLDRIARRVARFEFVGLNEVRGGWGPESGDQAHELASRLRCGSIYLPFERRWFRDDFGNAILSRLRVLNWSRQPLPFEQTKGHGNFTLAEVDVAGGPLRIIVTHVDHRADRARQLEMVASLFLDLPEPAILMGDLNSRHNDPQIRALLDHAGVDEVLSTNQPPAPADRIDWIFIRGLECLDAGIEPGVESDHPLVWAELRVSGTATIEAPAAEDPTAIRDGAAKSQTE